MEFTYTPQAADWLRIAPELVVGGMALVVLLVDLILPDAGKVRRVWLAAVALIPRIRHGRFLLASAGAAVFGCLILLATDNAFGAGIGTLLVGCGFSTIYPLIAERIGGEFPYFHPGFFNGIFSIALTGGMLAPWTLGHLADIWGVGVVMALPLAGTIMVFALVLLIWLEAKIRLG